MSTFLDANRMALPTIKITGYKDEARSKKIASLSLPYLQESLDVQRDQSFNMVRAQNDKDIVSGTRTKPSSLKVTFILDDTTFGTPLIAAAMFLNPKTGSLPSSVESQIKTLAAICYAKKAENPLNYLTIQSNNMPLLDSASGTFHGLLKSMNVKNELVDTWGDRIKALVECEFSYSIKESKSNSFNPATATQSLALTAGTTMAGAAFATYGTTALTGALAKANNMDSLRGNASGLNVQAPPKGLL